MKIWRSDMKKQNTLKDSDTIFEEQAQALLKMAEESGLASNFLFTTTFERYRVQLDILRNLKESLRDEDVVVTKEYVKGKKNLYSNPAVIAYNRTTDTANKTVATLLRILKSFDAEMSHEESDPLMDIINSGDADDEQ
jgi:hypothetical protein